MTAVAVIPRSSAAAIHARAAGSTQAYLDAPQVGRWKGSTPVANRCAAAAVLAASDLWFVRHDGADAPTWLVGRLAGTIKAQVRAGADPLLAVMMGRYATKFAEAFTAAWIESTGDTPLPKDLVHAVQEAVEIGCAGKPVPAVLAAVRAAAIKGGPWVASAYRDAAHRGGSGLVGIAKVKEKAEAQEIERREALANGQTYNPAFGNYALRERIATRRDGEHPTQGQIMQDALIELRAAEAATVEYDRAHPVVDDPMPDWVANTPRDQGPWAQPGWTWATRNRDNPIWNEA